MGDIVRSGFSCDEGEVGNGDAVTLRSELKTGLGAFKIGLSFSELLHPSSITRNINPPSRKSLFGAK
jgi:hypothetical protein